MSETHDAAAGRGRWLDRIERVGNALPDPTTLFLLGTLVVIALSQAAVALDWSVEKAVAVTDPATGAVTGELERVPVRPVSLLTADGSFWLLDTLVDNFMAFPPLGVVLVGMLGIGLAERTGFIGALLKAVLLGVPARILTPTIFFVGVMSSMGLDAGYVVLPPLAAALYKAVGRSPLVGLAAVFAGVSAGFSANLFVTSLDPLLAGLSTESAHLIDPSYEVAATANLHFMIASTGLLTAVGWAVTAWWVEPRFASKAAEDGGPVPVSAADLAAQQLDATQRRGLGLAALAACATLALFVAATWIPGAPLHGSSGRFPRWVSVIVPLLFLGFLVPGLVYGFVTGELRNDKDVAKVFGETMAGMGPYIVLAFFAAQFIACFAHSNLGEMLALAGGDLLARARLPVAGLIVGFIAVVMAGNLFIGSMSAKFAFFAPVFVPMFMQVGVSPELTQAAYRVGDSVTNVITPLNPYVVILLVFMQRYVPRAGIGTLVALMLPYALAFAVTWTLLLAAWIQTGLPLGPEGPLAYTP
ncbi:MAG: AbgT family transporter [Deltaproteobacteria bacterium]|nr:AbgT family transporter [Deltaproteobacteria bacterium]MBW2360661.1 AbgT family transporter [Deltaproteobacteria bacterium]